MKLVTYISGAAVVIIGLAVVIAWAGRPDDDAVATVGSVSITADDFRGAYIDYLGETGLPDEPARRSAFLERLVGIELVIAEAKRNGLHESDEFRASQSRIDEKLRIDYYGQRTVLDTIEVSEGELRAMFLRMNTSIKARHLYAPTMEEAAALKGRLDAGETFEDLAREVFDDPRLAESGGSVGYFGFDEMDPAFEDFAYSAEIGEVSGPVRTSSGYSIVQVEDRQPKPLITENEYATSKDRVDAYVTYRRHAQARKELVATLVDGADVEFEQDGLALLLDFIEGTVQFDDEAPVPEMFSRPLVTFDERAGRTTWTVGDFRVKAQRTSPEQREAVKSEAQLRRFVEGLIAREAMLDGFDEAGWARNDDFTRVAHKTADTQLYELAYTRHVAGIAVPADTVRAYFDRHTAEFQSEPSILVDEIIVESRTEGQAALAALKTQTFGEVAAAMSVRPGADQSGGRLGYVTRSQLGVLADTLFRTPVATTIGPIEVRGKFAIFSVVDRVGAAPADFDDVRADIEELLRQQTKRGVMRTLVDSLRSEFPVTVDLDRVHSIDLRQKSENG